MPYYNYALSDGYRREYDSGYYKGIRIPRESINSFEQYSDWRDEVNRYHNPIGYDTRYYCGIDYGYANQEAYRGTTYTASTYVPPLTIETVKKATMELDRLAKNLNEPQKPKKDLKNLIAYYYKKR